MIRNPHTLSGWLFFMLLLASLGGLAQEGNVAFVGQTTELSVEIEPGVEYTWELFTLVEGLNLAEAEGNCPIENAFFVDNENTGASVEVTWLKPGRYFFRVIARDDCSNNLKMGIVEVVERIPFAEILEPDPICLGDIGLLRVEISGDGPFILQYTDGHEIFTIEGIDEHLIEIPVSPEETTHYSIVSVTDVHGETNDFPTVPVTLRILPRPVTSPIIRVVP